MAAHKASDTRSLEVALRHRAAARAWLDQGINPIQQEAADLNAKLAADSNGSWDTDYVATHGTEVFDSDTILVGQYKRTLREILVNALAHRRLANKVCDVLEEISVSYNGVLAQMDADGGTLSDDATYEAFRIADEDLLKAEERLGGQHKATTERSLTSALSHRRLARKIIADMIELQEQVNSMVDVAQANN